MRIAIVDDLSTDAKALRKFLCRWASEQGIPLVPSPVILESGEALLAHFAPNAFDIIFLDIYMAGITGMEVAPKNSGAGCALSANLYNHHRRVRCGQL